MASATLRTITDHGGDTPDGSSSEVVKPPTLGTGSRGRRGPVKITVNILTKVMTKLEDVCDITGESRTDAINRAIQLYALYHDAVEKGEQFRIVTKDGREREFHVL